MDINDLKGKAEELKGKAEELKDKAQETLNKPEVQEALDKGKEFISNAKDKLEDFVEEKTDGKGILGFGAKDK